MQQRRRNTRSARADATGGAVRAAGSGGHGSTGALGALALTAALLAAPPALAASGPWTTDLGVGTNSASFTLDIACSGNPDVCNVFGGYSDVQVSNLSGSGMLDVDPVAGTLQFAADGLVDVGLGPVPSYFQLFGTDLQFATIPFFGIPEVQNPTIFSLDSPLIDVSGVDLATPGDYPFSTTMTYSGLADVVGDVSLVLPEIVVDPQAVTLTGTLRVLGDVDSDMMTELELRDLQVTFVNVDQYVDLGATLDIIITADMDANLSAEVPAPLPPTVPLLGPLSLAALAVSLAGGGSAALRRTRRGAPGRG